MKKILIHLTLFCLSCTLSAQADFHIFPKYKQVVHYFFTTYSIENIPENGTLSFEKHPEGWRLLIRSSENEEKVLKDLVLWDKEIKGYKELPFIRKKELEKSDKLRDSYMGNEEAVYFDACPYYGYTGWHWDVVKEYEHTQNLPDTIQYGVGRAFSTCASNLLNTNAAFSDKEKCFTLKEQKNSLTPEQLGKYRYYRQKAIDAFKKVAASNPDFETIVGSIVLKLSHEYMSSFLDLRIYQNEAEAIKELPENLYSDFYMALAKNYLIACEKDAVLFVNGDSDTYPLLYMQEKYNFRKDVLVINASLLQSNVYVNHLRENVGDAKALALTYTPEDIQGNKREFLLVTNDSLKVRSLQKVLKFVKNDKNQWKIKDTSYFYLEGRMLSMKLQGKTITWKLPFREYLTRNHLIMLDIIAGCGDSRPVFFACTLDDQLFLGLDKYTDYRGMVYKLGNKNFNTSDIYYDQVNDALLYTLLTKEYSWKGTEQVSRLDKSFVNNYANQFYLLVMKYIHQKEKQKAVELIELYLKKFPNSVYPYDYISLSFMECYYRLGEGEKGNEIGKQVLENMKNRKVHLPTLYNSISEEEYNEAAMRELKKKAKTYHQESFFEKLW